MAEQKVVVVTGAAGGIGTAVCRRLSKDGFAVAALDMNGNGLKSLRQELGRTLEAYTVDQTDEVAVRAVVTQIENGLGPINSLVNVLGWTAGTRFDQEKSEYWRQVIAINYEALLYIVQPVLLAMISRKKGRMVFVASEAGRNGANGQAVYAGAKGAVIAFAKSLARENAKHNITVNCVSPGPTETALYLSEKAKDPELVDRLVRNIPMRRPALAEEQAAAISFLLSPDADYITGQTLSVSGGLTMY